MSRVAFRLILVALLFGSCRAHEVLPPESDATVEDEFCVWRGDSVLTRAPFPSWVGPWEWIADPHARGAPRAWPFDRDEGWRRIQVGAPWQAQGIDHVGVGWYRRTIRCEVLPRVPACLTMRALEDSVGVFLNGALLATGGGNWADLDVVLRNLRVGDNLLAIRVVNSPHAGDPRRGGLAGPVELSVAIGEMDIGSASLVMVSSRLLLSHRSASALEEYTRVGGTVLVVFHDAARWWEDSPLERILPTRLGLPNDLVGVVRPRVVGPLGTLVGHEPVEVKVSLQLPDHPRFVRPGTREISRWHPSPLSWDWACHVVGDDPAGSPLLTSARYGAGLVVACTAPELVRPRLVDALVANRTVVTPTPPVGTVWARGPLPWQHLRLQGFEPGEDPDVLVLHRSTDLGKAREALARGATVLALDPSILDSAPDLNPWSPLVRTPLEAIPLADEHTWAGVTRGQPTVLTVSLPEGLGHEVIIEGEPWGPVRGVWSDAARGRQGPGGSWSIRGGSSLSVGVWARGGTVPPLHRGGKATVVTARGIRLDEPLDRPSLRATPHEVLWRWEDGEPALAVRRVGKGRVACFSVPLKGVSPRELDWSNVASSKARFLREDTSQLVAFALADLVSPHQLGPVRPSREGVTVEVATPHEGCGLRWRFSDWQRIPLSTGERVLTSVGKTAITLPWPAEVEPQATERPFFWLDLAVLSPTRDRSLAHVELSVPRPGPILAVWYPSVFEREKGPWATWPRLTEPPLPPEVGPASQYPLFRPGERIRIRCESWGSPVPASLSVVDLLSGSTPDLGPPTPLVTGPWQVVEWSVSLPPSVFGLRARAGTAQAGCFILVSPPTDLRSATWDKGKGVQVLGSLYEFGDPRQFAIENLCAHADSGIPWGPFARSRRGQPWADFIPNPFCFLPNGVHYRAWNAETIRSLARHPWTGETLTISASLVDGFNGVPWPEAFVHPQHLALFARWMASRGRVDLLDLCVDSLASLALGPLAPQWRSFVATEVALPAHRMVLEEIRAVSPASTLTDQFDLPLLPTILRIPDVERFAQSWQELFSLSSSDAWNVRAGRGYHTPTYLVCLGKALAPNARVGHYHMEMLGGIGPERIATRALIHRQNVDLFWMMAAGPDGWVPVETYVDGGGVSWLGGWQTWLSIASGSLRGGHVAFPEDWRAMQTLYALAEVIRPRKPRGFVLAAVGPRIPERPEDDVVMGDTARLFGMLRGEGLPISAMGRLDMLGGAPLPEGLVVPVPGPLTEAEREGLATCLARGVSLGVVGMGLDPKTIARYLGIDASSLGRSIAYLPEGNVRGPFWPDGVPEDYEAVRRFVTALKQASPFDVESPTGVSSYAFDAAQGLVVVLMEERGEGRKVVVKIRGCGTLRHAAELIRGEVLPVRRTADGVQVEVHLPGAGAAVVVCRD